MASIKGGSSSKAERLNHEKAALRWIRSCVRSLNATRHRTHKDPDDSPPLDQESEAYTNMIQKDPPDHNRTRSGRILISGFWSIAIDRYCAYFNRSAATAVFCST